MSLIYLVLEFDTEYDTAWSPTLAFPDESEAHKAARALETHITKTRMVEVPLHPTAADALGL